MQMKLFVSVLRITLSWRPIMQMSRFQLVIELELLSLAQVDILWTTESNFNYATLELN